MGNFFTRLEVIYIVQNDLASVAWIVNDQIIIRAPGYSKIMILKTSDISILDGPEFRHPEAPLIIIKGPLGIVASDPIYDEMEEDDEDGELQRPHFRRHLNRKIRKYLQSYNNSEKGAN